MIVPPTFIVAFLSLFYQTRFEIVGVGLHFAGGNFLIRRALKAEFANSQTIFGTNRRTENAARHGARFVELTETCLRIEHGAGLIVGKIGKLLISFFAFVEHARRGVARKLRREALD